MLTSLRKDAATPAKESNGVRASASGCQAAAREAGGAAAWTPRDAPDDDERVLDLLLDRRRLERRREKLLRFVVARELGPAARRRWRARGRRDGRRTRRGLASPGRCRRRPCAAARRRAVAGWRRRRGTARATPARRRRRPRNNSLYVETWRDERSARTEARRRAVSALSSMLLIKRQSVEPRLHPHSITGLELGSPARDSTPAAAHPRPNPAHSETG